MKLPYSFIFACCMFICAAGLYAQQPTSFGHYAPGPCNDFQDVPGNPQWTGPYERTICADTIPSLDCGDCCYTLVYYQRVWPHTHGIILAASDIPMLYYDFSVTSIFYSGPSCNGCDQGKLLSAFYNSIAREMAATTPDSLLGSEEDYQEFYSTDSTHLELYTAGVCYQQDSGHVVRGDFGIPVPCDTNRWCCVREYRTVLHLHVYHQNGLSYAHFSIQYLDTAQEVGDSTRPLQAIFSDRSHFACPDDTTDPNATCGGYCYNLPVIDKADLICNMPCNTGTWEHKNFTMSLLPMCPGCSMYVEYDHRVTDPCPMIGMDRYTDVKVKKLVLDCYPLGDTNCIPPERTLLNYAIDSIFQRHLDLGFIPNGGCDDNFRVMTAGCWGDFWVNSPYEAAFDTSRHDARYREFTACNDSGECCIRYYKVCRSFTNVITDSLINVVLPMNQSCYVWPFPCNFICEELPPTIMAGIKNDAGIDLKASQVEYNRRGSVNLQLEGAYMGELNMRIYTANGDLIAGVLIDKRSGVYIFNFDVSKYSNGAYFYQITSSGKNVLLGKFIVEK